MQTILLIFLKEIMKRKLLFLIALLVAVFVSAGPISKEEAMSKAQAFVNKKKPHRVGGPRGVKLAHAQAKMTQVSQDDALYYVFNVGECDGFVIVSGDDRTPAVLGYTDSGTFDAQNLPDNLRAWLQGYADQLAWLQQHPEFQNNSDVENGESAAANAPTRLKALTKNPIRPLMASEWNQDFPYNADCPIFLTGNQSVTGCAATAMAQLMYYHRHPDAPTQVIPSYTYGSKWGVNLTEEELPVANFDWENMLPSYSGSETNAQNAAVAMLMHYCGVALKMDYADEPNGGSSAYTADVADVLKTYFDYSATTQVVKRGNYSISEWNDLIYSELMESRPVCYNGRSAGGGHAFVVDGYDGDELFHVNWGWGGYRDGYFLLSVLNPGSTVGIGASSTDDGYSFDQQAIIGIKPYDGEEPTSAVRMSGGINKVEKESDGTWMYSEYMNYTGQTREFEIGVGYVKADGTIVCVGQPRTFYTPVKPGYGWFNAGFRLNVLTTDGVYRVVPISREQNTPTWYADVNPDAQYVEVVVSNGVITSTTLCPIVVAESITFPGNKKVNETQQVDFTIKCEKGEFYGPLYLFASKTSTKGSYQSLTGITVSEGKTATPQFSFTPSETGTYNIWISKDEAGENVIASSSVEIEAGGSGVNTTDIDLTFNPILSEISSDGNYILGSTLKVDLVATNPSEDTYFPGKIQLLVYEYTNGMTRIHSMLRPYVTIGSSESNVLSFTMDDITPGNRYAIEVQYQKNGTWVTYGTYKDKIYTAAEGVFVYDSNGEKTAVVASATNTIPAGTTAVDLRGNTTTTMLNWAAAENPNCLYILDETATAPTGAGTNIVKGNAAASISLQDGFDFYSPIAFTANNVSYTRTFASGLTKNYNGWTTLVLPFDVNNVTVDLTSAGYSQYPAYPIDWFHSADDAGKNFWVMEFGSEENGIVNFSHVAEIKAARPLLIAVPGAEWGADNDLTNLPITFHGTNATFSSDFRATTTGDNYKMKGVVVQKNLNNVYVLNADGNLFERQGLATVEAFRTYFEPTSTAAAASTLMMAFGKDHVTALQNILQNSGQTLRAGSIYDLQGRKVNQISLPKGIYIVNGKKILVK